MKKLLLLTFLNCVFLVNAQEIKTTIKGNNQKSYYTSGKKISFTAPDSTFQMDMGLRIQSLTSYTKSENESGVLSGQIRRLRLKFDGFVLNPKISYKMELGLSPRDMQQISGDNNGNVVLDAVMNYHLNDNFKLSIGQTKLPSNIQRVVSSGSLQFVDRTINNSSFNTDRDFGLFGHYAKENKDKFYYGLYGAVTMGEGRNWTHGEDDGVCLSGKLELYPFGAFTKNGAYFEGDLLREKNPKLLLSGAFAQNNNAHRVQGQLGSELYETRTLKSVFVDAVFKYNGWDARVAYMTRDTDNPITVNPDDITKKAKVFVGEGFDAELSYVFPSNYQIAGRFSAQKPGKEIAKPDVNEYSIGVSKYLKEHKLKFQADCSYDATNLTGVTSNSWNVRFQVEIGL